MTARPGPAVSSPTLAEFVKARLDEDEAAARESHYEGQRWITEEEGVYRWPDDELVHLADRKADARHIARHDPARVLREVEAKRAILGAYQAAVARQVAAAEGRADEEPEWHVARRAALHFACSAIAAIYSDHAGYRLTWPEPRPILPVTGETETHEIRLEES